MRSTVLLTVNQHAKFEVSSFADCKDMTGDPESDHSHQWVVCPPKANT